MRALLLLIAAPLMAQQQTPNVPHAGYIYPAGGRQGTTVEAVVGGQFLNGASEAYVNGAPGVSVLFKRYTRPLTPAEANDLREQVQKLNAQPTRTAEEAQTVADIRRKLMDFQRRTASPAIAENALLEITIAPDALPGPREIRVGANQGITNPIAFVVGTLQEVSQPSSKVPPAYNTVNGATPPQRPNPGKPAAPQAIELPVTLNGQVMPAATDRYKFHARKGQHIVAAAVARELVPYISDAVPGWFQAALCVRDASGKELAAADHYYFHPDPVLFFDVPADGDYTLEIHDSIYRGREDFVYRIHIGELPYLAGIFPLGVKAGSKATVEAQGVNLPSRNPLRKVRFKTPGTNFIGDAIHPLPFVVDVLPSTVARETAARRDKAQRVKLPIVVDGRIAQPGASQYFRIDAKAGEEIIAAVTARRLQSPLDSVLRIFDSTGRQVAVNDDCEDRGAGLLTHQADSYLQYKAAAKGAYYVQIADAQHNGGPEYAYRLRLSHPQPDFELRVVPSSLNVRAGSNVPVTVYALRRDGFTGEIALKLKDAPQGFALAGAEIPAGEDRVRFTLAVPPNRVDVAMPIQLEGRSEIAGHEVRHIAVPADEKMQAFAWFHLVPESAWMLRVVGAGQARNNIRAAAEKPVRVHPGSPVQIQVLVPPRFSGAVKLALNDPPEGLTIQKVSPAPNGLSVTLAASAGTMKPGMKGNLIVDAFVERPTQPGARQATRRQPLGAIPAIPFEVE